MMEIVRQTLALTMFDGTERPLALLEETAVEQRQEALSENCQVHVAPNDPNYVDSLQKLLAQEQPTCLFLTPPLIPPEKLSKKLQKQYPRLGLHEIALQVALENAPEQCLVGVWLPHGFFVNVSSQPLREQIRGTATPRFIVDYEFSFDFSVGEVAIKLYLLVVQAGKANDKLVRFFRCPKIPTARC